MLTLEEMNFWINLGAKSKLKLTSDAKNKEKEQFTPKSMRQSGRI